MGGKANGSGKGNGGGGKANVSDDVVGEQLPLGVVGFTDFETGTFVGTSIDLSRHHLLHPSMTIGFQYRMVDGEDGH